VVLDGRIPTTQRAWVHRNRKKQTAKKKSRKTQDQRHKNDNPAYHHDPRIGPTVACGKERTKAVEKYWSCTGGYQQTCTVPEGPPVRSRVKKKRTHAGQRNRHERSPDKQGTASGNNNLGTQNARKTRTQKTQSTNQPGNQKKQPKQRKRAWSRVEFPDFTGQRTQTNNKIKNN